MFRLRQRPILSVPLLVMATASLLGFATIAGAAQTATFKPGPVLAAESKSKALCEAGPNRIFVETNVGSECIAYFVTKGFEARPQAVLYFSGDAPSFADEAAFQAGLKKNMSEMERLLQGWADRLRVRYVYVSRPGLQGSSGNHNERAKPKEAIIMNAVTGLLKARLGLESIALVGQSRGSTIVASLLTMRQKDVKCAILGSGALELVDLEYERELKAGRRLSKDKLEEAMYDPAAHINSIEQDPTRRVFVLGDPADTVTPLAQQVQFLDSIKAAGHNGVAIEVDGEGHHGVSKWTIPVAGACLNNLTDDLIIRAVARGQLQHALSSLGFQRGTWKPTSVRPVSGTMPSGAPNG